MQIVINIPDGEYKRLTYIDIFKLRGYIENGVLLPKGHGDLVDRNGLKKVINQFDYYDQVLDAPTIIEADKAILKEK